MLYKSALVGIIVALVYTNGGAFAATGGTTRGGSLRINNPQSASTTPKNSISVASNETVGNPTRAASMYTNPGLTKLNKITPSAAAASSVLSELEIRINDLSSGYNSLDTKYDQLSTDVSHASQIAASAKSTADSVRSQLPQKMNVGDFERAFDQQATARQLADQPYVQQASQNMASSEAVTALTARMGAAESKLSAIEATPHEISFKYVAHTATEPGRLETYRDGTVIAKSLDKCTSTIAEENSTKQLTESCIVQTLPSGTTNPTGATVGTKYTIGSAQPLPNEATLTYKYTAHTITEPGRLETLRNGVVIAKSLDKCSGVVSDVDSSKALEEVCTVQDIPENASNASWSMPGSTYTIGTAQILPKKPTITYAYIAHTDTEPGRIETYSDGEAIAKTLDKCGGIIKAANSSKSLQEECTVQEIKTGVRNDSNARAGDTYVIGTAQELPAGKGVITYKYIAPTATEPGRIETYSDGEAIAKSLDKCTGTITDGSNSSKALAETCKVQEIKSGVENTSNYRTGDTYTIGNSQPLPEGKGVITYKYIAHTDTDPGRIETYSDGEVIAKTSDKCSGKIKSTNSSKSLQEECTVQEIKTGVENPSNAVAGTTYSIGDAQPLPARDGETVYVFVYHMPEACSGSGDDVSCPKPGYVTQHKDAADGDIIATIPDRCSVVGLTVQGFVAENSTETRGVGQTCKAGAATSGYPTGWTEGKTYNVGGASIPPKSEYVKLYVAPTGCSEHASCTKPGYVAEYEKNETNTYSSYSGNPVRTTPDECTLNGVKGASGTASASYNRGIKETCTVGKANLYPTNDSYWSGNNATYTMAAIEIPPMSKEEMKEKMPELDAVDGLEAFKTQTAETLAAKLNTDDLHSKLAEDEANTIKGLIDNAHIKGALGDDLPTTTGVKNAVIAALVPEGKTLAMQEDIPSETSIKNAVIAELVPEGDKLATENFVSNTLSNDTTLMRYTDGDTDLEAAVTRVLLNAGTCTASGTCSKDLASALRGAVQNVVPEVEEAP